MPLQVEFVLETHVTLFTSQVDVFLHVEGQMALKQELLLALLAVKGRFLSIMAKVGSAVET